VKDGEVVGKVAVGVGGGVGKNTKVGWGLRDIKRDERSAKKDQRRRANHDDNNFELYAQT